MQSKNIILNNIKSYDFELNKKDNLNISIIDIKFIIHQ